MRKFKLLYLLIAFVAAAFATSCTESDEFAPGEPGNGAQVYFSNENTTEFSLSDEDTSIDLVVNRIDAEEAKTITILSDVAVEAASLFNIPSSVTFAAGEKSTKLTIGVDIASLEDSVDYNIDLLINDSDNTTPYGLSSLSITVARWPWELFDSESNDINKSKGKLRAADFFCGLWDMDFMAEIDVTVYKHKTIEGVYMIENPWAEVVTAGFGYEDPLEEIISYFSYADTNLIINCTDPEHVFIEEQFTGLTHPTYGQWYVMSLYPDYGNDAGVLENNIITFPERGLLFAMSKYNDGGLYYGNTNGMFRVLLPGAEVTDYSLAAEYDGMKVEADGETASAIINFTYGADVTGIDYVVAAGNLSEADVETAAASIIDGTAENINKVASLAANGSTVSEKFALETSGMYSVVAVALDKAGKPTAKGIASTNFFFPGMGGATAPDCEIAVELMNVSEFNPDLLAKYPDETSLAVMITGTELAEVTYYLNKTEVINGINDGSLGITWDDVMTAYGAKFTSSNFQFMEENGYWGGVFGNRTPGTSYTMAVLAKNVYGKSALVMSTCSTKEENFDDYTGELVIGKYYMTCTPGSDPFENTFSIKPVKGSTTDYIISSLGRDNSTSWHAEYDAATSKFTVNGIEVGYEEDGNLFGTIYGYFDAERTMVYGFMSISPDNAASDGSDPCVFSVDPTTKKISAIDTTFIVAVYENNDAQKLLGSIGYFSAGTPVTFVGDAAASAKSVNASVKNVPDAAKYTVRKGGVLRDKLAPATKSAANCKAVRDIRILNVNAEACEPLQKTSARTIKGGAAALNALK